MLSQYYRAQLHSLQISGSLKYDVVRDYESVRYRYGVIEDIAGGSGCGGDS